MNSSLQTALNLHACGLACIPVNADKVPLIKSWRAYMTDLPTKEEIGEWFADGAALALCAGEVQCIDVDEKYQAGLMAAFESRVRKSGLGGVWDRCLIQKTPSGGYHLVFRSEGEPFRNMKLAQKGAEEKHLTLIETRGAGGYFLIAPSEGYEVVQGDFEMLPVLTEEERADLLDVARSFNARSPRESAQPSKLDDLKPGDDYDVRGDVEGLLTSHGWTKVNDVHWRRPGKDRGISASFGVIPGRFWVWSTSTAFESEHLYRPYAVYAVLEHGGDFREAARALKMQGYGTSKDGKLQDAVGNTDGVEKAEIVKVEKPEEIPFELKSFDQLQREDRNDWNNIIGDRWLCRGSCAMLFGYSGVGKSSLTTQLSICWALGKETLGLKPARPLNILLIQAENDEGDLAEMRDGGVEGLIKSGLLTKKQADSALPFIYTIRVSSKCGAQVGPLLEKYAPGFDLVILDPLFAYLGGDALAQKDVSFFLRNVIDPVISRLNVAMLIIHHTNKPKQDDRHNGSVSDMAYLSAGSAELTNYPRGILAVLPTKRDDIFQLVAAKRGGRLGWGKLSDGRPRRKRFIGHSDGYICWREIDDRTAIDEIGDADEKKSNTPQAKAQDKADRIRRSKEWLMAKCLTSAALLQDIHNTLELKFELTREQDRRNVIRFVEETGSGLDRVKARKGKVDAWILGRTQEAHELKVKIEKEYQENQQSKISQFAPDSNGPDSNK